VAASGTPKRTTGARAATTSAAVRWAGRACHDRLVPDVCDSCGAEGGELVAVHRVYVTPAAWDTEEKVDVVPDVERWCYPCRTHYPHQEVDATD
jgi:hypothetical protein